MAENKKSFILYCDWIHTVEKLDDEQAGKLFKHLLRYVNDLDPVPDDKLIDIAFEPIRQQLKRDLQKYQAIVERNQKNGQKGGRPRKTQPEPSESNPTQANPKESKKPSGLSKTKKVIDVNMLLLEAGYSMDFKEAIETWFNYKKEKKKAYTERGAKAFIKHLVDISEGDTETAMQCIEKAMASNWDGVFPIKDKPKESKSAINRGYSKTY
jgi:hypothetical protein